MKGQDSKYLDLKLCPECIHKPSVNCAYFSNKGMHSNCYGDKICLTTCAGQKKRTFICESLKGKIRPT